MDMLRGYEGTGPPLPLGHIPIILGLWRCQHMYAQRHQAAQAGSERYM